jgi:CDP-diacylglycerol--glycerol-3-phosphate 3-phosphatidyltransferase
MLFSLPNQLTWARILMIPLVVGVFYLPESWLLPAERNLAATVFFVVAAVTDWFDGWLARKLSQTSAFGAFLDPVADKLMVASLAARSPSPRCASGWRRSAQRAASPSRSSAS